MANVSSSNGLEKRPKLRFPGFDEPWKETTLSALFSKSTQKNADGHITNVICNSAKLGLIPQREYFDKDIANSDNTSGYYIIRQNDFVYNPRKSYDAPYGPIRSYKYAEDGIVSPLYLCFHAKRKINPMYYEWYFRSSAWHRYIYMSGDSGARHDRVSIKDDTFFAMPINLPSEQEQSKIASFLQSLDERIAAQEKLVASLKKYKRGLVFHIFRDNNPFGFEMKATPMKDLLHEYRNRDTVNLRVCSVAVNKGVVDQVEHLGRSFAAADTSNYGRVKPGDVVYTKSPTGCFPYGIVKQNWMDEEVAVSPLYGVYTPVSKDAGYLLHTYFEQSQNANNYIRTLAQKGAKNTINITTSHFLDKSILFPSNEDCVSHLAKMFDAISAELSLAEKELELLLRQRKTLLQQLFI